MRAPSTTDPEATMDRTYEAMTGYGLAIRHRELLQEAARERLTSPRPTHPFRRRPWWSRLSGLPRTAPALQEAT